MTVIAVSDEFPSLPLSNTDTGNEMTIQEGTSQDSMISQDIHHQVVDIDNEKMYEDSVLRLSRLASEFRERMTETVPQGGADCPYVRTYGHYRKSFYEDVIEEAEKVRLGVPF